MTRVSIVLGALLLPITGALGGCAGDPALAASLANAARPSRMPKVVACWEKEFAESPVQTGYLATVDFVIAPGAKLRDAKVRALVPIAGDDGPPPEEALWPAERKAAFSACVEAALDESVLPTSPDSDGPGFSTDSDLPVRSFRIAFVDASAKRREAASARQTNVLVGPRADRCQGLYSHDPPQAASTLYAAVSEAEARAGTPGQDPDSKARELQKAYDSQLELLERLGSDLGQPAIPEANRARLRDALAEAHKTAARLGARIGCKPPGARNGR
ncbi:MAG: hypothetical protein U0359_40955 [Byssovorax sp.]